MPARLSAFARYVRTLASMGTTPAARARIVLVALWLLARDKVRWLPAPPLRLHAVRHGRRVGFYAGDYQDLEVMRELYIDGEYAVPLPERVATVLDLGANVGFSALELRARYPDAAIYAVEPDPVAFAKLERNTRDDPRIRALNVAVAGEDGERLFYSSRESVVSGFARTRAFQEPVRARTRTIDSLMEELALDRVDLLKLDVEGAEREALEGFAGLDRVGTVVGELHFEAIGCSAEEFYARFLPGFDVMTHIHEPHRCTFTAVQRQPSRVA